jgi:hypothetical protein
MNKIIGFIFAALLSVNAAAALPETDKAILNAENIMVNPGFESGTSNWTASGGTFTAPSSAKGFGGLGGSWASSAAAQTLKSSLVAIPAGLRGKNAVLSCMFKASTGTATHTFVPFDGTSDLTFAQTITSSASQFIRTSINFIAPSSGSMQAKITSVNASEPTLLIDSCYMGPAEGFNVVQVNQASFAGAVTWPAATNCLWTRTSNASFASYSADSDCTYPAGANIEGQADAPSTKIPAIKLLGVTAGAKYRIESTGSFGRGTNTQGCSFRFTDGVVSSQPAIVNYSTGATVTNGGILIGDVAFPSGGDKTVEIQGTGAFGSTICEISSQTATTEALRIAVYKYPSVAENAIRNPLPFYPTYTAKVSSAGVVSDESSDWLSGNCSVANTSEFTCTWNSGVFSASPNCTATGLDASTGAPIVKVLTQASSSSVVMKTYSDSAVATAFAFQLSCQSQTAASAPAPILVGSVTSSSPGAERIERADLNCDATSSITSQSGSWLSAIGNRSTAACSITIAAGIFSATPTCTFTTKATTVQATAVNMTSATAGTVYGASADYDGYLMCMGPR